MYFNKWLKTCLWFLLLLIYLDYLLIWFIIIIIVPFSFWTSLGFFLTDLEMIDFISIMLSITFNILSNIYLHDFLGLTLQYINPSFLRDVNLITLIFLWTHSHTLSLNLLLAINSYVPAYFDKISACIIVSE